jgi:hypothetical protein
MDSYGSQHGSKGSNPSEYAMNLDAVSNVATVTADAVVLHARKAFARGNGFTEIAIGFAIPDLQKTPFPQVSHGHVAPSAGIDRAIYPDSRMHPPDIAWQRIPHRISNLIEQKGNVNIGLHGALAQTALHA